MRLVNEVSKALRRCPTLLSLFLVRFIQEPISSDMNPLCPIKGGRYHSRREIIQKWNLVLLHFVKCSGIKAQDVTSPPIYLSRDCSPEDLIEHCVRHIVIWASAAMFRNSKRVLRKSQRGLQE